MEFRLRRSTKRQSSSAGATSSKSSSKLAKPLSNAKNNDVDRLKRRNHDHNLSHKYIKSSDPRIQPAVLVMGHHKYAHTFPPRGTLDTEKLDYLTWRMHLLFAEQVRVDDQSGGAAVLLVHGQDEEAGVVEVTTEKTKSEQRRPGSSYSASLQSTASSSSNAAGGAAAVAMDRATAMEPGWIYMKAVDAMNGMMQDAKVALKQALINDNALAAIPLLEREERLFDDDDRKHHDRHRRCQEARHSSGRDSSIGGSRSGGGADDSSIEEMVQQSDDTLPPPLMPASMFYRASVGLRQKPVRTTSAQNVVPKHSLPASPSMSKLRSIFRLQPRRSHSEGAGTLYTLGSAP